MFVNYGVSCVPINGFEIAHKMGIKVIPYSAIAASKRWLLLNFMRGYCAMLEKIHPETIICFGTPFPEMQGNIVTVDYRASRKVVR